MTAPTPSPEEFAWELDDECIVSTDFELLVKKIAARGASLTAPLREEVERLRAALDEAKNWLMSIAIVDQDDRPLNERLARDFDWRRRSMTQESIARRGHEAAARALAEAENARLLEQCVPPQVAHDAVGVCRDLAAKLKGDAWPSADVWWYRIQLRAEAIDRAAAKAPAPEGGPGKEATREA